MTSVDYAQFDKMSPFEIKDGLITFAKASFRQIRQCPAQRRPRQPELDRDGTTRGIFPVWPIRTHRSAPRDGQSSGRRRRDAATRRRRRAAHSLAVKTFGCAGGGVPRSRRRFQCEDIRVRRGRLRLRNDRFNHRRQLSGARPDAGSRREGCSPLPDVGDVRRQAAARRVQALRGRGRNRRHVLHLQIADGEPHPQERRYHRPGHADLHALSWKSPNSRTMPSRSCM